MKDTTTCESNISTRYSAEKIRGQERMDMVISHWNWEDEEFSHR